MSEFANAFNSKNSLIIFWKNWIVLRLNMAWWSNHVLIRSKFRRLPLSQRH